MSLVVWALLNFPKAEIVPGATPAAQAQVNLEASYGAQLGKAIEHGGEEGPDRGVRQQRRYRMNGHRRSPERGDVEPELFQFMRNLDVKEIHGYEPELGLRVFTDEALV